MSTGFSREELERRGKEQGGKFVKLEDGDEVIGYFLGKEFGYETVYNPRDERSEDYDKENPRHQGLDVQTKVEWNFYDQEQRVVRIITLSMTSYMRVRYLQDKKGDQWISIEREGKKKKTKYHINVAGKIDPDELEDMKNLKLHELGRRAQSDDDDDEVKDTGRRRRNKDEEPEERRAKPREERRSESGDDRRSARQESRQQELPVEKKSWDPDALRKLKAYAKELSNRDYDGLLDEFGIERINDLDPSKDAAATAYIRRHLDKDVRGNGVTHQSDDEDQDPFAADAP